MTIEEWARDQQERRRRFDEAARNCRLKPPEAFSDEPAPPEALWRLCLGLDRMRAALREGAEFRHDTASDTRT